jgi:hypothetical protein
MNENIFSRIYKYYSRAIYPKISHIRGSHRLKKILESFAVFGIEKISERPEEVFEKSWDNLLILDACRYDFYSEFKPDSKMRITKASDSPGYIQSNFSQGDYSDVVYITGNPFFDESKFSDLTVRKPGEVFHDVFHTYKTDWSEDEGTVLPKELIRDAKTAKKLYPDKKIVVHFMQPHFPFITQATNNGGIRPDLDHEKEDFNVWQKAERGLLDHSEVISGYRQNIKYIIEELQDIDEELSGKTVITADHGNLLGENGLYGHNYSQPLKGLREVPWDEL